MLFSGDRYLHEFARIVCIIGAVRVYSCERLRRSTAGSWMYYSFILLSTQLSQSLQKNHLENPFFFSFFFYYKKSKIKL